MLSAGIEYATELNNQALIEVYGQELNEKTYAICKSDTMIKGKGYENIHLGNSFTDDALPHETFHYMLCNPPFGVEWKNMRSSFVTKRARRCRSLWRRTSPRI